MAGSTNAKARTQWVAAAMKQERERFARQQQLMGELYDEISRYLASIGQAKELLSELTADHGVTRQQIKELFSLTDREIGVLYESREQNKHRHAIVTDINSDISQIAVSDDTTL